MKGITKQELDKSLANEIDSIAETNDNLSSKTQEYNTAISEIRGSIESIAAHSNAKASTTAYGHVKIGSGLSVNDGVISASTLTVQDATTSQKGIVQLSTSTSNSSATLAATASAVKAVNDKFTSHMATLGRSASADGSGSGSVAVGTNAIASNMHTTAVGNGAKAAGYFSVAVGSDTTTKGDASLAVGASAVANDYSICIGGYASSGGSNSAAIGVGAQSPNANTGIIGTAGAVYGGAYIWRVAGNFSVAGTKNFEIPHPHPDKTSTHVLRHGAVESPTAGDTLYRYTIEATENNQTVELQLPDYFEHLNTNVNVWVNPHLHFGRAFGIVENGILKVTCETAGKYNTLVIGTRNDDHESVQTWHIKGVEREIGESWLGETYVFEVDEISEVTEIEGVNS